MRGTIGDEEGITKTEINLAALGGHVAVLGAVVDFLTVDRRRPDHSGDEPLPLRVDKLQMIFDWSSETSGMQHYTQSARLAVTKCTSWVARAWRSHIRPVAGRGREVKLRRRITTRTRVEAFLVTTKVLIEVVETCGLPLQVACEVTRDEMNIQGSLIEVNSDGGTAGSSHGSPEVEPDTNFPVHTVHAPLPQGNLRAAFCSDFIRALCGREFCAVLSRLLLADMQQGVLGPEEFRLKSLLSRQSKTSERGVGLVARFSYLA